jgi:hypothetical protein
VETMKHKIMGVTIAGAGLVAALASATPAAADPGPHSPQANPRTLMCDGHTYTGGFVGNAQADFYIDGSTKTFAIKRLTILDPSGTQIFNTGINGFDTKPLITCTYTNPDGVFHIAEGFFTPGS